MKTLCQKSHIERCYIFYLNIFKSEILPCSNRGVVQLFNAVREHQKTLEKDLEDAGPIEHKKDKVLKSLDKRAFLDVLMGPSKSQPVSNLIPKEVKEDPDNPTWSILRDDFMMGSKLKDWDKQDSSEVKDAI
ncbi:RRP15-like protein [Homalodisca vitripennis]|uniref:RRP15-like protein n=1 Tax=Homalodisca vitripennis TaxID=197043 RepID=UPI001EEBFE0A|nr:RRP15-like protein [Homalodisca vitripennis]